MKLEEILENNSLKREFKVFPGHEDFTKGMNIHLKRKDVSVLGKVFEYKEYGYDEEHIIEEIAGRSQICFGNDFFEDGKGGKYALTAATYIAPDLRNRGIGTALVRYQEYLARSVYAEKYYITHVDNEKFWSKMGYTKVHRRLFVKTL